VTAAIERQARSLINSGPAFFNGPQAEFCATLARATGLDHVFLCSTGAEANEGAIKLARKWGTLHKSGAYGIVTATDSFHGRTLATMSASGKPSFAPLFEPKVPGFRRVPPGDLASLAAAIDDNVVAVMIEPIQGEAGVIVPPEGYLKGVRALTEQRGVLFIADEVQTGTGRTGTFLACEHDGVRPDVVTLGKGVGGGVPLAAMLCRAEVSCFEAGEQGGTYSGNALTAAVGIAVVETIRSPGFLDGVMARSARLRQGLERIASKHGGRDVRGRGLLLALELGQPTAKAVASACFDAGLLVNAARPTTLRFVPALNVREDEIDLACERLDGALATVRATSR
jgi:acetylornithine/N-succinyldiaminopimelate aminotransferase